MRTDNESKRLAFETLLDRGTVCIAFVMLHEGVVLPQAAKDKSMDGGTLALKYSRLYNMPQFTVTDEGVRAVLTFNGKSAMTFVPWEAVLAVIQNNEVVEQWTYTRESYSSELKVEVNVTADPADPLGDDVYVEDPRWLAAVAEG